MATMITINGSVTLDESSGLQNTGAPETGEDNNDNDVLLGTLQTGAGSFYDRLFDSVADGGLGLSTTFPSANGVAESASNFIVVSGGDTVTGLGFVDGDGDPLPEYGGADPGVATPLSTVEGNAIRLFADPVLGDRMVLGVEDGTGDIVLSIFMDPSPDLTTAQVWMVQLGAILNPINPNPDDPVDLFDSIGVGASTSLSFNFNALPSGQNLFGSVGTEQTAIVVIGKNVVLKPDGTYANTSDTINTSQGGGPTTIGVGNQMFDPNEGAYFTYVKGMDPRYLAGAPDGLDQNEADDADFIQYSDGTLEATGGFAVISQTQGPTLATMKITAYDIGDAPQGTAFVSGPNGLGTGASVNIDSVQVFDAGGMDVTAGKVSITGGVATVSGLDAGFKIAWTTDGLHDRVLIEDVAGKFDIGGFGVDEASADSVDIGGQLRFEDSGPTITASATGAPTLTVDESNFAADSTGGFSTQFTPNFGTDGEGSTAVAYALSTPGGASGLKDTLLDTDVVLSLEGGDVVGRAGVAGPIVFTVSVDGSGMVTLDQQRAVVHPNPDDPDESRSLTGSNLVVLNATATDGDNDPASVPLDLTPLLAFKDDGPSITATATGAPTLTVDETDLGTDHTQSFSAQFASVFGADGPGDTPVGYALSTTGGPSGLTDTATNTGVVLSLEGGDVVGRAGAAGPIVFTVSVDGSGNVTLDQQRAVVHTDPNDPDESLGHPGSDLVVLSATAIDGDEDHALASLDLTPLLVFKDDGPSIGSIANSTVNFEAGASATQTLNGAVGNDPNSTPYTIVDYDSPIMTDGATLEGVLSADAKTVTYWEDTNGDGTFGDAGDTAFYKLELSDTANAGAGSYTFTTLVDAPPALLTFDLSTLPSGQNLFGTVEDAITGETGFVVIGEHPLINPDGTYTNASDTINTSKGGGPTTVGVNNQMFDPGEGAYFTYVEDPDSNLTSTTADDADNIVYNGFFEANEAQASISQTQGNTPRSLTISAYDTAAPTTGGQEFVTALEPGGSGPGDPVDIISVTITHANGTTESESAGGPDSSSNISFSNGVATLSDLAAGDTFDWVTMTDHNRVLIHDLTGKFDIGGFSIIQNQPTPAQDLPFTVQATDGDTDFAQDSFNVHINAVVA